MKQENVSREAVESLSPREREVLGWCGHEVTTRDMAKTLHRSPRTVEKHMDAIKRKTGVRSRVGLALLSYRLGLHREVSRAEKKPEPHAACA